VDIIFLHFFREIDLSIMLYSCSNVMRVHLSSHTLLFACVYLDIYTIQIHTLSFFYQTNLLFVSCIWIGTIAGARKVRSRTEGWGEHKSGSTHGSQCRCLRLPYCWIILLVKDTSITSGWAMTVLLPRVRRTPTDILIQDKRCKNKELLKDYKA
jgi:hypothetical protein